MLILQTVLGPLSELGSIKLPPFQICCREICVGRSLPNLLAALLTGSWYLKGWPSQIQDTKKLIYNLSCYRLTARGAALPSPADTRWLAVPRTGRPAWRAAATPAGNTALHLSGASQEYWCEQGLLEPPRHTSTKQTPQGLLNPRRHTSTKQKHTTPAGTHSNKLYRCHRAFVIFRFVSQSSRNGGSTQSVVGSVLPRLPVAATAATLVSIPSLLCIEGILGQSLYIHIAILYRSKSHFTALYSCRSPSLPSAPRTLHCSLFYSVSQTRYITCL